MTFEGIIRYGMVHLLSGAVPFYIVNEFPKSGGTWVSKLLSRALDLPFPQHRIPYLVPSVIHGHYITPRGMRNVVTVWRDGRDVMLSWYHHQLFSHGWNERIVGKMRKELPFRDYHDVETNLPAFIEYNFERPLYPRFTWSDYVRRWYNRDGVVAVRYEDLHIDPVEQLQRIVVELTGMELAFDRAKKIVEEFAFSNQSGREPGEENKHSHLRKGVVGDWENYFTKESRLLFKDYAGDELIKLGYEQNGSWIRSGVN